MRIPTQDQILSLLRARCTLASELAYALQSQDIVGGTMEYISNQLRGMGGYPPVEMQGVNVHAVVFLELMRREVVWYLEDARERVRRIRTEVAWVEGEILSAKEVVGRDKVMELEKGVLDLGF